MGALKAHTANHCRLKAAVVCVNERERCMNQMRGAYEARADCHHECDSMSVSSGSPQAPERLQGPATGGRQPGAQAQTRVTTQGEASTTGPGFTVGPHGGNEQLQR